MTETLEKITWERGRFIDSNKNPITPEAVGLAVTIEVNELRYSKDNVILNRLSGLMMQDKSYEKVNAYSEVLDGVTGYRMNKIILNFYKV